MAASARMLGVTERMMGFRVKKYGLKLDAYYKASDRITRPDSSGITPKPSTCVEI